MKLKALVLALFLAGLGASFALAGPPPGKGKNKGAPVAAADSTSTGTTTTSEPGKGKAKQSEMKYWVCHKSGNSGKYVKLRVSKKSVKAHTKHGDVLPDASGNCPAAAPKSKGDDGDDDETTSTSTTTTTTPTTTKPGKGCGDKNHLHERRFECKVVISNVSKKEGNSGLTIFAFPVTLSAAPLSTVTVDYATADGTALAGLDYLSTSGTVTFPAGVAAQTINVWVIGNALLEPNETFYVKLSNPSPNAYLGDTQGVGTILDD